MAKEAKLFRIATPNREFTGRRAGVLFELGLARVRDEAKRDQLVNEFHYQDVTAEVEAELEA